MQSPEQVEELWFPTSWVQQRQTDVSVRTGKDLPSRELGLNIF